VKKVLGGKQELAGGLRHRETKKFKLRLHFSVKPDLKSKVMDEFVPKS